MPHLVTSAPPSEVAAALAAYARDWRESRLPDRLRAAGVYGVTYRAHGDGFRLTVNGVRSRLGARCDGEVLAGGRETLVRYRVTTGLDAFTVFVATLLVIAVPTIRGVWTGSVGLGALLWPVVGAAFLAGLVALEAHRVRVLLEPGLGILLARAVEASSGPRAV